MAQLQDRVITLNVGGVLYTTKLSTLLKYPNTKFAPLATLGSRNPTRPAIDQRDVNDNPFFDRDGPTFRHVLNFMRDGRLTLPGDFQDYDMLVNEAKFYEIEPLVKALRRWAMNSVETVRSVCMCVCVWRDNLQSK